MLKSFNTNDYLIRVPLFIIFFWFGVLKVLKMSPATELIIDTVFWMPLLSAENWVVIIGYWEMAIGLCFLNKKTTLIAVILMFLQMSGTFLPLVILPEITFQNLNPAFEIFCSLNPRKPSGNKKFNPLNRLLCRSFLQLLLHFVEIQKLYTEATFTILNRVLLGYTIFVF